MIKLGSSLDPEDLEPRLDLNRPELKGLLKRYAPRVALIVGRDADDTEELRVTLVEDGWQIESCIGPNGVDCPLLRGRGACTKRECADVAVVFVEATHSITGSLPLVRCAADTSSPAVVALEGQADPPVMNGDRALVGALRTARTIADTADTIARMEP
jgi:hypothetical protein